MADAILVLNAGSSSLKFSVFLDAEPPRPLLSGHVEELLTHPRLEVRDASGDIVDGKEWETGTNLGHDGAIEFLLGRESRGAVAGHRIVAAGHRVVHGGTKFIRPVLMDDTTGILASGKYRHRSCVYGHIRIDECTGFHPIRAERWLFRVSESEPMTIWNGIRKLFLKERLTKGTRPERYLTRISSAELGWLDRQSPWMCDSGDVISFSEGNGQQEALLLLPAFGWISSRSGLYHLVPDRQRPWYAEFKHLEDAGG